MRSMLGDQTATADPGTDNKMVIVYDGECPFCRNYVRLMALKRTVGNVDLVNARTPAPAVRKLVEFNYDMNEGMAAIYGDKIYYGSDAVVLISSMTSERGWAARLLAVLLRHPGRARFLYPFMKVGRRIALRILGKPLI
jgi:predicted DCC family thiol-disulfide oxidoreductase YuxK